MKYKPMSKKRINKYEYSLLLEIQRNGKCLKIIPMFHWMADPTINSLKQLVNNFFLSNNTLVCSVWNFKSQFAINLNLHIITLIPTSNV